MISRPSIDGALFGLAAAARALAQRADVLAAHKIGCAPERIITCTAAP